MGACALLPVANPELVLAEVARVLRPGGQYLFIEHVAADPGTIFAKITSAGEDFLVLSAEADMYRRAAYDNLTFCVQIFALPQRRKS